MEDFICFQCNSKNTYYSGEGYNRVLVCKDCHSEEHKPKGNWLDAKNAMYLLSRMEEK